MAGRFSGCVHNFLETLSTLGEPQLAGNCGLKRGTTNLAAGPYLVLEENDAAKADQTAHNFKPDVILLDIVMPKIDGGELATQIEADRELHDTPIIFLTALATHGEAKSGLLIQGHPLVAKPISIPELIDAIEKHLPARAEC